MQLAQRRAQRVLAIVNATLGFASPDERFRAFASLRNIGDKRYAATTDYPVSAARADAAVFNPGLSRSLFAGVQLSW